METTLKEEITGLLIAAEGGDPSVHDRLAPRIYGELRRMARRLRGAEDARHPWPATTLVNEMWLHLVRQDSLGSRHRAPFLSAAGASMRRMLVDQARTRRAMKRGEGRRLGPLEATVLALETRAGNLLALEEALEQLAADRPRKTRLVELCFFLGVERREAAEILAVSRRQAARDWELARAWLRRRLDQPLDPRQHRDPAPPPDPDRVEELFHSAFPLPPVARRAFVAQVAGGNEVLQHEVLSLLESHRRAADGFLEPPAEPEVAGRRIGPFTLRRLLGEDGMGTLHAAEQDHPHRLVALEVLRVPPGLEHDPGRFEREMEVVTHLRHPGIAQVFEGGTIDEPGGRLVWFAMELVPDARSILAHAAERMLDLPARLALFNELCRVIGHGHRHGVLHHDLRPDNVLVDDAGHVRVIGFGVAPATGVNAGKVARHGDDLCGTLPYLSPEQCADGDETADARADVYSLGVLLYQLLTGELPHALAGMSPTEALDTLRIEPPLPPSVHRPGMADDLQTILLVALEKDRERRYPSVEALAKDLSRFRRTRPILARPSDTRHTLRLFARRHRQLVTASLLALVLLVAAVVVSSGYGLRAIRAAERENEVRVHTERVTEFLEDVFHSADMPRRVSDVLDRAVARAEATLDDDPEVHGDVLVTLGATYAQLGDYGEAERILRRAEELGAGNRNPVRRAALLSCQGFVALHRDRYDEAQDQLDEAMAVLEASPTRDVAVHVRILRLRAELERLTGRTGAGRATLGDALALATPGTEAEAQVREGLGSFAQHERDYATATEHFIRAFEILTRLVPADHMSLGIAHRNLAQALFHTVDAPQAELHWHAALRILEATCGPDHPDVITIVGNLGFLHQQRGEFEPAEKFYRRALGRMRELLPADHPGLAGPLTILGQVLLDGAHAEEATTVLEEAYAIRRAKLPDHWLTAITASVLGESLAACGEVDRGRALTTQAIAPLRETLGRRDFRTVQAIQRAIRVREDAGDIATELRAMLPEPGTE